MDPILVTAYEHYTGGEVVPDPFQSNFQILTINTIIV
jgi:hypothetical protein